MAAPTPATRAPASTTPSAQPDSGDITVDASNRSDVENYIRYAAAVRGIDPDVAVTVAAHEGLGQYAGDNNSSFGPFQLHYGGVAPGGNRVSGMGDTFTAQTGLDARDPSTVKQQIDFAMDVAAKQGWNPGGTAGWHGATVAGIQNWQGIGSFKGDPNQYLSALNRTPAQDQGTANAAPAADVQAHIDTPEVQDQANAAQATAESVADQGGGLLGVASSAIGSKYVWGGKGGRTNFDTNFVGSDCSGFVAWAFKVATGIDLPAQTSAIYAKTTGITADQAQPGDLVEYNMGQGPQLEHVGIYLGGGKVLHDSSLNPDGGVEVTTLDWTRAHIGRDVQFRRVPGLTPDMVGNMMTGGAGQDEQDQNPLDRLKSLPGQAVQAIQQGIPNAVNAVQQGAQQVAQAVHPAEPPTSPPPAPAPDQPPQPSTGDQIKNKIREAAQSEGGQAFIAGARQSMENDPFTSQAMALQHNLETLANPASSEQERNLAFIQGATSFIAPVGEGTAVSRVAREAPEAAAAVEKAAPKIAAALDPLYQGVELNAGLPLPSLPASRIGRVIPAIGPLVGTVTTKFLDLARFVPDRVYDAARTAATGGALRGLDGNVLSQVPGMLDKPIPNGQAAQILADASKAARVGGKITQASNRLAREAKLMAAAGTRTAPQRGEDLANLIHRIAPNVTDGVLSAHGMEALTKRYRDGHAAAQGFVPAAVPQIARLAANLGIGGVAGAGLAQVNAPPDDPDHFQRTVFGGLAGMAALSGGNYTTLLFTEKNVIPAMIRAWNGIDNPMRNLQGQTISVVDHWGRTKGVLEQVGKVELLKQIQRSWGDPARYGEIVKSLEQTGNLPSWVTHPEAQDAANTLMQSWNRAVKAKVVDDVLQHQPVLAFLPDGRPSYQAMFPIHHVPAADWMKARAAAGVGLAPKQLQQAAAGLPQMVRGNVSRFNVLSHMPTERTYASFEEGEAHGVKYDYSKLPELLADQYASWEQAMSNQSLSQQFQGLRGTVGRLPAGASILDYDILQIPKKAGIPGEGLQAFVPTDRLGFGNLLGNPLPGHDLYVSKSLGRWLDVAYNEKNLFSSNPYMNAVYRQAAEINQEAKEMLLGGNTFHLWNVVNQFINSNGLAPRALAQLAKVMKFSVTPGSMERLMANPANRADVEEYVFKGGGWNTMREVRNFTPARIATYGATVAGTYTGTYASLKAAGKSDDDAHKGALFMALTLGALPNLPLGALKTGEWTSVASIGSDMLFHKTIPMMKLMTWMMNGKTEAAARFTNEAFGGDNLAAMLRSRSIGDIARYTVFAPEWTGGFLSQAGGALFDSGAKGVMNRGFYTAAAINTHIINEIMNQVMAGHSASQNPPGQEQTIDLSPYFDRQGWNRTTPGSGEKAKMFWDMVPTYSGMFLPLAETGRWAMQQMGSTDPNIVGGTKPGQPLPPDPAKAWATAIENRQGVFGSMAHELTTDTDYYGRPVNAPDDPMQTRMLGAIGRALARLEPVGASAAAGTLSHGGPWQVAAAEAITGQRTRQDTEYGQAQTKREYEIQHGPASMPWTGKTLPEQQTLRTAYQTRNEDVAMKREAVRADPTLSPADKAKKLAGADYQFETLGELERSMIPQAVLEKHPEAVKQYMDDLAAMDAVRGNAAGEQSADYIGSDVSGLNPDRLYQLMWHKDDSQLASAKTDANKAALRRQWTTEAAQQFGIDHDVAEDFLKSKLFGEKLDPLPGMSSANLNQIRDDYEAAVRSSPDDVATSRALGQQVIAKYAAAFKVDAGALQRRVYLRTVAPKEQTPADQAYNRAITVLESTHNITTAPVYANLDGTPFTNPDTGQPSTPNDWKKYDVLLSSQDKWDKYKGIYKDRKLEAMAQAKARGAVNAAKIAFKSPGYWDYERNFGIGRSMDDATWAKLRAGTLDMWRDQAKISPQEAQKRNNILALYKALTPQERLKTSVTFTLNGHTFSNMKIAAAVHNLNANRSNAWKAGTLKLDQNITDADAPPGADLSLVDTTGSTP